MILWKSSFVLRKTTIFKVCCLHEIITSVYWVVSFWWRKIDAKMMKKTLFSDQKSIRNDGDPKSDEKHLQTRFPTPPFGQQMRFLCFFAARQRAAGLQKWRPGGVREVSGRCPGTSTAPLIFAGSQNRPDWRPDGSREVPGHLQGTLQDDFVTDFRYTFYFNLRWKFQEKN